MAISPIANQASQTPSVGTDFDVALANKARENSTSPDALIARYASNFLLDMGLEMISDDLDELEAE